MRSHLPPLSMCVCMSCVLMMFLQWPDTEQTLSWGMDREQGPLWPEVQSLTAGGDESVNSTDGWLYKYCWSAYWSCPWVCDESSYASVGSVHLKRLRLEGYSVLPLSPTPRCKGEQGHSFSYEGAHWREKTKRENWDWAQVRVIKIQSPSRVTVTQNQVQVTNPAHSRRVIFQAVSTQWNLWILSIQQLLDLKPSFKSGLFRGR